MHLSRGFMGGGNESTSPHVQFPPPAFLNVLCLPLCIAVMVQYMYYGWDFSAKIICWCWISFHYGIHVCCYRWLQLSPRDFCNHHPFTTLRSWIQQQLFVYNLSILFPFSVDSGFLLSGLFISAGQLFVTNQFLISCYLNQIGRAVNRNFARGEGGGGIRCM